MPVTYHPVYFINIKKNLDFAIIFDEKKTELNRRGYLWRQRIKPHQTFGHLGLDFRWGSEQTRQAFETGRKMVESSKSQHRNWPQFSPNSSLLYIGKWTGKSFILHFLANFNFTNNVSLYLIPIFWASFKITKISHSMGISEKPLKFKGS